MIISPSVLSMHYDKFSEEISQLNEFSDWLHFDVMDGNFVPNISFGPKILADIRKNSELFMDVHLMINDPDFFTEAFVKAGADAITFHYENYFDIEKCLYLIDKIHSHYIKAGISIKPDTKPEVIIPLLFKIDLVLVMSVEPGFGGQTFILDSLDKVSWLYNYRQDNNLSYLISDDGGVNDKTAHELIEVGCDILVAGSYVFDGDISANIKKLRKC